MKSSIRDKAEGALHQVKGKVKEVAGKISDNSKLRHKGRAERIAGKVQMKIGQAKKVMGK
ncbi:MAG: CsbD family protein [Desulfuromonadales bacterium]